MKKHFIIIAIAGTALLGRTTADGTEAPPFSRTATIRVKKTDGQTEERIQKLNAIDANVCRLAIPVQAISNNTEHIDVVFDIATAKQGETGYFVVSTGVLGKFREENGKIEQRRNPMPVFGMKNPRGAFVGIIKGLKYEFTTVVDVTNGVHTIFPRFLIKEMAVVPYEDIVVDFYMLKESDADYSGMARAYRQYQLKRGEVRPLRERVKGNPHLAYTADTMFVRVAHGYKANKAKIEHQTPSNEPPVKVTHTFDDLIRIMKGLKELGVEKVEMCSVGWNLRGHDGRYPTLFPVEPAFGGEAKLREAIDCAHGLGYQIVCHVDNTDFYTVSERYNKNDVAKRPDGTLLTGGVGRSGRAHLSCFQRVYEAYIEEDYRRLSALGFKGTFHIDVTSCITPYPCFDPKHPLNRQQTADYMNLIGEKARRTFGGFGSEGPCDHVAKTLDYALYVTAYPRFLGRPTPLMDRIVPFWQIAYHGIILSNPYYSTTDYSFPNSPNNKREPALSQADRRLKVHEFGGRPTFYYSAYKNLKPIKEAYDEYQPIKHLQYEFMDFHDEIAKDVFLTRYGNGSEIVTNYTDEDYLYRGRTVKAKDCLFIVSRPDID